MLFSALTLAALAPAFLINAEAPAATSSDVTTVQKDYYGPPPAVNNPNLWNIIVKTGNRIGSGTDARVFIQFGDGMGHHVNTFLNRKGRNDFERKSVWGYNVVSSIYIPDVCSVVLSHDRSFMYSAWFVDYVTIQNGIRSWTFPISTWIRRDPATGRASLNINRCPNFTPNPIPVVAAAAVPVVAAPVVYKK